MRSRAAAFTAGLVLLWVAHPLPALLVFNAVVVATHLPVVTDTLMRSQLCSRKLRFHKHLRT